MVALTSASASKLMRRVQFRRPLQNEKSNDGHTSMATIRENPSAVNDQAPPRRKAREWPLMRSRQAPFP